jgi:hypothetical protein
MALVYHSSEKVRNLVKGGEALVVFPVFGWIDTLKAIDAKQVSVY